MSALAATDDPLGDLRRCAATYRRFALENPTYYALMFGSAVPGHEPSERAEEVGMWALGRVVERVQRAIDAGVISCERDPAVVAAALWACEHGLVSLELGGPGGKPGRFDWDAITAVGVDAITRGLTGPA